MARIGSCRPLKIRKHNQDGSLLRKMNLDKIVVRFVVADDF